MKLPTWTSLLKAASQPTGIVLDLLPSIFGAAPPARRTGNRSPLSALLLMVPPMAIPLADEGPDPIGRQARTRAMSALPISHTPMTPLGVFEQGAFEDWVTDRPVCMAATPTGIPSHLKSPLAPSEIQ